MNARTARNGMLAAAIAAGVLAASGTAFAQADNSNAVIDPAASGGNTSPYGPDSAYTTGYPHQWYYAPNGAYREPAYPGQYRYSEPMPPIVERADSPQPGGNPSRVDPVTGVVTAPGYSGPKDVSK